LRRHLPCRPLERGVLEGGGRVEDVRAHVAPAEPVLDAGLSGCGGLATAPVFFSLPSPAFVPLLTAPRPASSTRPQTRVFGSASCDQPERGAFSSKLLRLHRAVV